MGLFGSTNKVNVIDLDSIIVIKEYDELQKELFGLSTTEEVETEEAVEEEEDEKPKRSKKPTRASSRKSRKDEDEDENKDDEKDEEEKPKKPSRKSSDKASRKKKKQELECPHGHEFGEDLDDHDECETCAVWTECQEKSEE